MRQICIYEADDGTQFENEMECQVYELEQRASEFPSGSFTLFDENGRRMDALTEEVCYIATTGYNAAQYLATLADLKWIDVPTGLANGEVGRWYYDTETDDWYPFEYLETKYKKIKAIFA